MLLKDSTKSERRDQEEGREVQKKCLVHGCLQLAQSKTSLSRQGKASERKVMAVQKPNTWKQIPLVSLPPCDPQGLDLLPNK